MTDLTDFLLARIAEDEERAHQARGLSGVENPWWRWQELKQRFHGLSRADCQHIERHGPARVLAECEAKRRIVARFEYRLSMHAELSYAPRNWDDLTRHYYETCRDLAAPYAEHPDYDESWRP